MACFWIEFTSSLAHFYDINQQVAVLLKEFCRLSTPANDRVSCVLKEWAMQSHRDSRRGR